MKKLLLLCAPMVLAACAQPVQTSSVPMDMQAVADYNQRVATGNTVNTKQKKDEWELNASDRQPKTKIYVYPQPYIYPRVHLGYGYY